jgi:hypothetical protein
MAGLKIMPNITPVQSQMHMSSERHFVSHLPGLRAHCQRHEHHGRPGRPAQPSIMKMDRTQMCIKRIAVPSKFLG